MVKCPLALNADAEYRGFDELDRPRFFGIILL